MRKRALGGLILLWFAIGLGAALDPWGDLRKGAYFQSVGDDAGAQTALAGIDASALSQRELVELAAQLQKLGDSLIAAEKPALARVCYEKVLTLRPDAWRVHDFLARIPGGAALIPKPRPVLRQIRSIVAGFPSSFLLLNTILNAVYWSGLFLWFVFALFVFHKYFRLAVSDVIRWQKDSYSTATLFFFAAAFLFPLVFLGGWAFYPFLIVGILFVYMEESERRAMRFLLTLAVFCSLLYAFNRNLERAVVSEPFQVARAISTGKLHTDGQVRRFDDDLKTAQAWAYWDQRQPDRALTLLQSTRLGFRSLLKFNLLAAIHLRGGRIEESIVAGKAALEVREHDPVALYYFAQALRRKGDSSVFDSYVKRYPELGDRQRSAEKAPRIGLPAAFLWRRALSPTDGAPRSWTVLLRTLGEFLRLPLLWLGLLLGGIVFLIRGRFHFFGDSAYCSKCERIIHQNGSSKNLCEECYQLFLLKDPVFFDAKVIKENEIQKRQSRSVVGTLLLSLLLPGLAFVRQGRVLLHQLLLCPFVILATIALFGMLRFAVVPLFFHWVGIGAILLYVVINTASVLGEFDGI